MIRFLPKFSEQDADRFLILLLFESMVGDGVLHVFPWIQLWCCYHSSLNCIPTPTANHTYIYTPYKPINFTKTYCICYSFNHNSITTLCINSDQVTLIHEFKKPLRLCPETERSVLQTDTHISVHKHMDKCSYTAHALDVLPITFRWQYWH